MQLKSVPFPEEIRECIEGFSTLKSDVLNLNASSEWDVFITYWSMFKMKLAKRAVECLSKMFPGKIKEAYYVDISGGEAGAVIGRDVDLIIVIDDSSMVYREELERFLEEVLEKLLKAVRIDKEEFTTAPTAFEIHIVSSKDKSFYSRLLSSRYTPPIKIWP